MSERYLLGVEEGHGDIDTTHPQVGPREAWGSWTDARRTEYLRVENAERRGYHPTIRPLYLYRATEVEGHGLSVAARRLGSTRHHMGLRKGGETKECRVHDLALPHTKRNRNGLVKCVRCGMLWGPLVGSYVPKTLPTPWCGYTCRHGCDHKLSRMPLAVWEGPSDCACPAFVSPAEKEGKYDRASKRR